MKLEDLSPELREKAKACKTADELLSLAKEEGVEIPDAELAGISGGYSAGGECNSDHCSTQTASDFG